MASDGDSKEDGRVARAQRLRESRRASVLVVARQVFSEKGYSATSIDDLIEAAGIARGTFYLYFESKRAIFDELLDGLLISLRALVHRVDVAAGAAPPILQLEATVERILQTLRDNRDVARILLREAVGIDAHVDGKLHDFYGRLLAMIVSAIETGKTMGIVRANDPAVVSRCILGAVKETVGWLFVEEPAPEFDAAALGKELIGFTLTGLLQPPA